MGTFESEKEGSTSNLSLRETEDRPNAKIVLRRGREIFRNDQVGSEFTKQLGTRRRRAQKTPLVPPVQAGFYFEDGGSPLGGDAWSREMQGPRGRVPTVGRVGT